MLPLRFISRFSDEVNLAQICHLDDEVGGALVVTSGRLYKQVVAVAYYIKDKRQPQTAEAAFLVEDRFQGRGLGQILLQRLSHYLHTGQGWFATMTKYLKSRHHLKLVAAFAAVYLIWGSTFLAIRFAVESMPPFWMAGTRFVIAGLVVYIWARRQGAIVPTRVHWRTAFIVGGLMLAGGNGLISWAGQFVASGLIGLLSAAIPMWVVIITSLATWQRPTRPVTLGILLGLAGILFLIGPENVTSAEGSLLATIIVVLGCISWAVGTHYSRQAAQHPSFFMATGLNMLSGGLLLLLGSAASGELAQFDPVTISLKSWLALGYLIVFGSLVGFSAYMWLVKVTTPTMASSNFYVNPVVAVILGWALAGEPLTAGIILPAAAIIAAVVLIVSRPAQPKAAGPDQPAPPALKTAEAGC